jgi:hypothetical protein
MKAWIFIVGRVKRQVSDSKSSIDLMTNGGFGDICQSEKR